MSCLSIIVTPMIIVLQKNSVMPLNNRKQAAYEIWKIQNMHEARHKSYRTVYNNIRWDSFTQSYRFIGRQDTDSHSPIENIP